MSNSLPGLPLSDAAFGFSNLAFFFALKAASLSAACCCSSASLDASPISMSSPASLSACYIHRSLPQHAWVNEWTNWLSIKSKKRNKYHHYKIESTAQNFQTHIEVNLTLLSLLLAFLDFSWSRMRCFCHSKSFNNSSLKGHCDGMPGSFGAFVFFPEARAFFSSLAFFLRCCFTFFMTLYFCLRVVRLLFDFLLFKTIAASQITILQALSAMHRCKGLFRCIASNIHAGMLCQVLINFSPPCRDSIFWREYSATFFECSTIVATGPLLYGQLVDVSRTQPLETCRR